MGNLNSWEFPARRFMDSSLLFILDSTFNIQHSTFNVIQWINDLFEQPGCLWLTLHSGRAGNLCNVPSRLRTEYSQPSFWMTWTLSKILDMTVCPPYWPSVDCGTQPTPTSWMWVMVWSGLAGTLALDVPQWVAWQPPAQLGLAGRSVRTFWQAREGCEGCVCSVCSARVNIGGTG